MRVIGVLVVLSSASLSVHKLHAQDPAPADAGSPQEVDYSVADAARLAQQAFDRGLAAYEAGALEEALGHFRSSNELLSSPNSSLMIARIYVDLRRRAEALLTYDRVIAEARDRQRTDPRFAQTLAHATSEREALAPQLAWLRVTLLPATRDGVVSIGRRELPAAAIGEWIPVDPGELVVRAEMSGYEPVSRDIVLTAGRRQELEITLDPLDREQESPPATPLETLPSATSTPRRIGVVTTVLGSLLVASAIATLAWTLSLHAELSSTCSDAGCPTDRSADAQRGRRLELSTWITGLAGLAALGGGIALVVTFD